MKNTIRTPAEIQKEIDSLAAEKIMLEHELNTHEYIRLLYRNGKIAAETSVRKASEDSYVWNMMKVLFENYGFHKYEIAEMFYPHINGDTARSLSFDRIANSIYFKEAKRNVKSALKGKNQSAFHSIDAIG